jgi:hypothetical protein
LRGYVYFMLTEQTDRIKIGYAADPMARLQQIGAHCAETVHLVGSIPAASPRALESHLHQKFAELRLHREWFSPSKELVDWIMENALTGADLLAEHCPEERPDGWVRPPLPRRPEPAAGDGWRPRGGRYRAGRL